MAPNCIEMTDTDWYNYIDFAESVILIHGNHINKSESGYTITSFAASLALVIVIGG